jgi:hypothetical protein
VRRLGNSGLILGRIWIRIGEKSVGRGFKGVFGELAVVLQYSGLVSGEVRDA